MATATTTATSFTNDALKNNQGGLVHRFSTQAGTAGPSTASLTLPDWIVGKAPFGPVPFWKQIYFTLRAILVLVVMEPPFIWDRFLQGSRNDRADLEGPFYISGAPDTQVADGKAITASREDLESNPPYLLTLRILSPSGEPLRSATIHMWQASTTGVYYNSQYRLRGVFKTDADGKCEVLAVVPGFYGLNMKQGDETGLWRAGHFHLRIYPPATEESKDLEMLTTQVYVCRKNDPKDLSSDFLNYIRHVREQNIVQSYSTSAFQPSLASPNYSALASRYSFPPVPPSAVDTLKSVDWWNQTIAERFPESEQVRVMAVGETTIKMNKKGGLSFF